MVMQVQSTPFSSIDYLQLIRAQALLDYTFCCPHIKFILVARLHFLHPFLSFAELGWERDG